MSFLRFITCLKTVEADGECFDEERLTLFDTAPKHRKYACEQAARLTRIVVS